MCRILFINYNYYTVLLDQILVIRDSDAFYRDEKTLSKNDR